ncbi:MAG: DUF1552 domain-containing protein [Deltaproteobacteria bacterium]|nr:DUF1552 domain-containing protein [Deltaproteobacteria bacterium]
MSRSLSRRRVLRGVMAGGAVSIALPRLGAMLNLNGDGYAHGAALPRRFGLWTTANGVIPDKWLPKDTGPNWTLSPALTPLGPVKDWFSVVSGLTGGFGFRPHAAGNTSFMTGQTITADGASNDDAKTARGPSFDQTIANLIGKGTAFRTLEIGVDQAFPPERGTAFHWWSHNGPDSPNPCIYDAKVLFDRLFANFKPPVPGGGIDANAALVARKLRKSVLDAVLEDAGDLRKTLAAEDRLRLESHLQSIRDIEARFAGDGEPVVISESCKLPKAPESKFDSPASDYEIRGPAVNKTMAQLLGIALACDLTRVFTFQFTQPGSRFRSSKLGVTDEFHIRTHNPAQAESVNNIVTRINEELRVFIEVLRDIPEAGGSLLQNAAIMVVNDCSYGVDHSQKDMPYLMIGRGGGKLRTGIHHRSPMVNAISPERGWKLVLSMARAVGADVPSIGSGASMTTDGLSAIEM